MTNEHGMRYMFIISLPFALIILPTLHLYILLIEANNDRPLVQTNMAKVGTPCLYNIEKEEENYNFIPFRVSGCETVPTS